MYTALTIAGSDCSGGAGIQADIKTMLANGVYASSVITALTAQNTLGVKSIAEVSPNFLADQIDAVFTDIFPDAVKIGMVASAELIVVIADKIRQYRPRFIVIDPVMVATSGAKLLADDALNALQTELLPLATVLTPNIFEAEILTNRPVKDANAMETAAIQISNQFGVATLCKGGHNLCDANDFLYYQGSGQWFKGLRIDTENTHGTGCTLSSAIAAQLARQNDLVTAVTKAKEYLTGALKAGLDLGQGSGPLDHGFAWHN